jgi:hypothetical protein
MARKILVLDPDPVYVRWRKEFASFEASCFTGVCEYVRVNFDSLLDRYYCDGHGSLNEFPAWVFERYLKWTTEVLDAGVI